MSIWTKQIPGCALLASLLIFFIPAGAINQLPKNIPVKKVQVSKKTNSGRVPDGSSMISMDYAAYLAPVDLHFTKPTLPIEGIPLGNGKMASLVWINKSGSAIQFNFGRPDVFFRGSATTTWTDSSHIDGNSKVGQLAINFSGDPFSNTCIQHLHTYDGYERVEGDGVSMKIVPWRDHDVFAIEITDKRSSPSDITIDLKKIKPDTIQGLYSFTSTYSANKNALIMNQVSSEKCNTGITDFPVAIKAAKLLNADQQLVPLWQEMLDNLAPYPTNSTPEAVGALSKAGEPVYAIGIRPETKGKGSAGSDHDPRMMMVNIFDMVNTESKLIRPDEWQIAMNTLSGLKVANRIEHNTYDGEPLTRFFGEAARMGSTEWVKKCMAVYLHYWNLTINKHPNHMRRYDTNEQSQIIDWQQEGTLTEGLSASLLQSGATSPGGTPVLRVFPAWPKDQDASFSLRAKGGFIVTSSMKNGLVDFIEIKANLGGSCTVRNYWGIESVDLYRNQIKSETLSGGLLTFKTIPSENIVLVKKGTNPADVKVHLKPATEKVVNLVPSEPGKSPNYWCSWSAQSYGYGQGAKQIDSILYKVESVPKFSSLYLNEEVLFGSKGWLQNFHQKVKNEM